MLAFTMYLVSRVHPIVVWQLTPSNRTWDCSIPLLEWRESFNSVPTCPNLSVGCSDRVRQSPCSPARRLEVTRVQPRRRFTVTSIA